MQLCLSICLYVTQYVDIFVTQHQHDAYAQMAMECLQWSDEYGNAVTEVIHFIMRGDEIVDLTPATPEVVVEDNKDKTVSRFDGNLVIGLHFVCVSL